MNRCRRFYSSHPQKDAEIRDMIARAFSTPPMTDSQAKLISFVRQHGGEIDASELSTFRSRSIAPMVSAGVLLAIPCGECTGCKCSLWDYRVEYWHCDKLRLRYNG